MMTMPMPSIDSVKVAVRVRPFSQREKNSRSKCVISMLSKTTTTIQDPKNPEHVKTFTFDLAYWSHSGFQKDKDGVLISADPSSNFAGQRDVFHDLGRGILDNAWQGYNATLLAYGQTGSGKSYSMIGFGANKGIIPNVCEELFQAIKNRERNQEYQVTFSMLEIYNEQVRDLLSRTKKLGGLKVREDQQLGFYVDGLTSVPCENYAQIEKLMEQGTKIRTTASTNMNASSSRSHMVVTIQFKQVFLDRHLTKQSSINLVDLAGSERQKSSGSEGDRLREGSRVNLSLTTLGNVISALADAAMGKKVLHIPYRDSILTKLLQSALGGNSRTTLIAAISPADICYEETLSTLRYAERAKKIWNKAVVNTWKLKEPRAENNKLQMMKTFPHLLNINEDPQLTGVLKYFIRAGSCDAGKAASNAITLQGLGILDKHASFTNMDGKVTVTPHSKCNVVVNGVPITMKTKLQHLVWIWSKAKFINRKFLMEELYQHFLDGGDSHEAQEVDPFWDPVEVVHLGSAHIWLQSLAYCMKFEEQVEFLNCDGLEEAMLHIHITSCSPTGQVHGEEDVVIDPLELLGKRIDFQIHIVQCLGIKWLKEDAKRGIQIGYRIYDLPNTLYTKPVWKIVNPQIEETVQFAALNVSQEFLNYLQTNALIVDLWGLQEGCAELRYSSQDFMVTGEGHIMVDTRKTATGMGTDQTTSNQISELYLKLLKLEQETELLRNINRALREENLFLKESLEKIGSVQEAHKPSSTLKIIEMAAQLPSAKEINQMCAQRASYDGELAKALKVYYQSMNMARGQFLRLRHYKPPVFDIIAYPEQIKAR
ncbi:kinesin-like protein KIF28P [Orycteropus afer afer]|uniref:Kinesin-like protein n=1 Tax=Orycteropus afer afer TaxID=1230840 RepID=A0A8B6ZJB0_ORYAF|nr:kinesin-like protein KIF28P [Orycteropus afer afer]